MAGKAWKEGSRWWRLLAGAAGVFLLWRGVFGRSRGRMFAALAGAAILRRAFGARAEARGRSGVAVSATARRSPEVVEVKSPAELEPGVASASPEPTFRKRVDRPRDPPLRGGPGR